MLVVAVSSRSLFHIEDGNNIFESEGQDAFNEYMRSKENTPLRPGSAFGLVKKLLAVNKRLPKGKGVEVVMLSRNSPDAGMRVMNSIQHYGLDIERAVFSQGGDRFRYAKAMGAHLFLSANPADVKNAIDRGLAAATLMPSERSDATVDEVVRIAFDGDSVLFSAEADETYRKHGLDAFREQETANATIPLGEGPFKKFLAELHDLQRSFPEEDCPIKIALVTARGMPAHGRVIHTLRAWDIRMDEAIFAAGLPKGQLLDAFGADIFFDDTEKNIASARSCNVLSGHVLYGAGGIVAEPTERREAVPA